MKEHEKKRLEEEAEAARILEEKRMADEKAKAEADAVSAETEKKRLEDEVN